MQWRQAAAAATTAAYLPQRPPPPPQVMPFVNLLNYYLLHFLFTSFALGGRRSVYQSSLSSSSTRACALARVPSLPHDRVAARGTIARIKSIKFIRNLKADLGFKGRFSTAAPFFIHLLGHCLAARLGTMVRSGSPRMPAAPTKTRIACTCAPD